MDRPTDELIQRMLAALVGTVGTEQQVDRLVGEARAEAEAEVKDLLKGAIKATLLRRAVDRLESPLQDVHAAPPELTPPSEEDAVVPPDGETFCYVYGITRAGAAAIPDLPGVDPRSPIQAVRHHNLQALTTNV